MEIALLGAVVIAGIGWIGWFKMHVTTATLVYYMKKRGYKLPDDKEINECALFVIKHLLRRHRVDF